VACFSQKLAVKPKSDEGYDAGTQVTFRVELSEPASRGNPVTAVLRSPLFSTSTQDPAGEHSVKWEEGQTIAMVDARIRTSQIDVVNGGDQVRAGGRGGEAEADADNPSAAGGEVPGDVD
jgi:hypothetical protein